jgi:hypothetical protein
MWCADPNPETCITFLFIAHARWSWILNRDFFFPFVAEIAAMAFANARFCSMLSTSDLASVRSLSYVIRHPAIYIRPWSQKKRHSLFLLRSASLATAATSQLLAPATCSRGRNVLPTLHSDRWVWRTTLAIRPYILAACIKRAPHEQVASAVQAQHRGGFVTPGSSRPSGLGPFWALQMSVFDRNRRAD